mgnify:CR=1 FL=1
MSSIPSNLARVSSGMVAGLVTRNLQRTNVELLRAQEQISTGLRVNRPSDDASVVGSIQLLERAAAHIDQQLKNLGQAQATIDNADQALGEVSDMLLEAQNIASSEVGFGATASTRQAAAAVVDSMIDGLLNLANREVRGVHLFGGERASAQPFVAEAGGVRYRGATSDLQADLGLSESLGVNSNGLDAFGAVSSRINGSVDLDPQAAANTRLVDVDGGLDQGVRLGVIQIDINGTPTELDLTGARTLGDVATRVNDVLGTAGSLGVAGGGLSLTANAGQTITIADVGSGVTAGDLGLRITAAGGTTPGADLNPRLTELTDLADLGVPVDLTSGLKITNGGKTQTLGFTAASTIRDMMNIVEQADLGVELKINDAGDGLRLVNQVSGTVLTVGENAGGSTASDLGLRSFDNATELTALNFGKGVDTIDGQDDLRIHLHDGSDVDVDLSGLLTVADVVAAINAAGGGSLDARLASDGNGIVVEDLTAGGDAFSIASLNGTSAASDLGLAQSAGAGAVIAGADVAGARAESVFTHLMMLRDGLLNNDPDAITEAGQSIEADVDAVAAARAIVGTRGQRIDQQTTRLEEQKTQTQSLLSDLRDADFNEVVTRFTQLQQQLEANLLSGQQLLSLSLLDFLR